MLQRLEGSRAMRNGSDTQDTLSFESCSSSLACDMEDMSSESSRKMQDTTSEASWTAVSTGERKRGVTGRLDPEAWKLEPEGET